MLEKGVRVKKTVAGDALQIARRNTFGDVATSFSLLKSFGDAFLDQSPGSVFEISVDDEKRFTSLFVFPEAAKSALPFLRPLVCVDATFLKGPVQGTLMSCVGMDATGSIFPLSFSLFMGNESSNTWKDHLRKTRDAAGPSAFKDWVFITDRPRGIESVFSQVLPEVHHCCCVLHLAKSVATQCGCVDFKDVVIKLSSIVSKDEFNAEYKAATKLKGGKKLDAYLSKIPKKMWSNAFREAPSFLHGTSNLAERWNGLLLEPRHHNPLQCIIMILRLVSSMIVERQTSARALTRCVSSFLEEHNHEDVPR
eukprot:TRINITY_DN389_c1_g1_i1.p1 TRINITY_DN389_c1_g1~~TRINITY_DN389_c1_g1_i1.p1  ORF type:complete len:309 (-),score=54.19 TRINITY_DN389_c1_g1_i1:1154-2080(-)